MDDRTDSDDLDTILSDQRRELMASKIPDSEKLQMQEAMAASLALNPSSAPSSSWRNSPPPSPLHDSSKDAILDLTATLMLKDVERFAQEREDHQRTVLEMMETKEDLNRRIHDQKCAADLSDVPEDYRAKNGEYYVRPHCTEESSSSKAAAVETENLRLHCEGLVSEERVRDMKVTDRVSPENKDHIPIPTQKTNCYDYQRSHPHPHPHPEDQLLNSLATKELWGQFVKCSPFEDVQESSEEPRLLSFIQALHRAKGLRVLEELNVRASLLSVDLCKLFTDVLLVSAKRKGFVGTCFLFSEKWRKEIKELEWGIADNMVLLMQVICREKIDNTSSSSSRPFFRPYTFHDFVDLAESTDKFKLQLLQFKKATMELATAMYAKVLSPQDGLVDQVFDKIEPAITACELSLEELRGRMEPSDGDVAPATFAYQLIQELWQPLF